MLYTYGFIARPNPDSVLSLPRGMQNSVQLFGSRSLQAIVELDPFPQGLPPEDETLLEAVLHHDRVVQSLFQQIPVLPLRFGSQFSTVDSLEAYLQTHEDLYGTQLQQFSDRAEFSLSFFPRSPAPESGVSSENGRSYFLAKKQRLVAENDRLQQQESQWQRLRQQIQTLYPQSIWSESNGESSSRVYLLVSFKRHPHLKKQISQWETTFTEWALSLSAPLPPYHFVMW